MCLCRSNGTGVVMRRRVAADARLPVAILLPVTSTSSPSPTVTIFFLFAVLFITAANCSPTSVEDSVDGTQRTGSSEKFDQVSEASETTSDHRMTSTNFGDAVVSSLEVGSQTTTDIVDRSTPVDDRLEGNNQFSRTTASMTTHSQLESVSRQRFRSSIVPEVAVDNTYTSTWSRLYRHEKAISPISLMLLTSSNNDQRATTSHTRLNDIRRSATKSTLSADRMPDVSSFSEDFTTTVSMLDEGTRVTGTADFTSTAADVEISTAEVTLDNAERDSRFALDTEPDTVGGGVDSFRAEYGTKSTSVDISNTWHDDTSVRFTTATSRSTTNRTTSRTGERKRCLQMRTGGNLSLPMDCFPDRIFDDNGLYGTANRRRRRLEFCSAYSAYIDFDCVPSSSCLDFHCRDIVRLDRLAQSINDQFVDEILNYYDCENRYSGVWNCSACKVTSSQ